MKNLLYLLLCVYGFSCQQKPSEIDEKLQKEQTLFYENSVSNQERQIKRLYSKMSERGFKEDEEILVEKTLDLQRLFLKVNTYLNQEDSLQFYIQKYNKKLDEVSVILNYTKMKFSFIEKEENQPIFIFKNNLWTIHGKTINTCFQHIGTVDCCFRGKILFLNATTFEHGNTISGKISTSNFINQTPLYPTIKINNQISDYFHEYSQIIDSTQKPIININVSYLKNLTKDTTFNTFVHYKIKK